MLGSVGEIPPLQKSRHSRFEEAPAARHNCNIFQDSGTLPVKEFLVLVSRDGTVELFGPGKLAAVVEIVKIIKIYLLLGHSECLLPQLPSALRPECVLIVYIWRRIWARGGVNSKIYIQTFTKHTFWG